MRPAGFEPATGGLEVRRFIHQNADSTVWLSQIFGPVVRICYPTVRSPRFLLRQQQGVLPDLLSGPAHSSPSVH